ncbi:MAG: response regulator [Gammaproteobacteria bacterium]
MSAHILIAEDETKLATLLADYLRAANMAATIVSDGAEVLDAIQALQPDLLLLDIMLPHTDGMTLCREVRKQGNLPIIMVTARVEEIDRLLGLELGADDYICKPFSPREVIARVKAVLRRGGALEGERAAASPIELDDYALRATIAGQRLDLTQIEFKLLQVLHRHPGRVYRREELLDLIYDDFRDVSDRTIDSHIKNLRRKLDSALPDRPLIHSVYGVGYRYEVL